MRWTAWRTIVVLYIAAHVVAGIAWSPIAVAEVAILESAILAWTFVALYSRVRWWTSEGGVQIMSLGLFVALLTTVSLLPSGLGFGIGVGEWIALVILTGMAVLTLNLVRLLLRARRH